MSYKREVIDVRVSQRILWVGTEAYPLHNIARAQTIKLVPKRGQALKALTLWVFLGAVTVGITNAVDVTFGVVGFAVAGVTLALIAISAIRLMVALLTPTFYALVIETAGTPYKALVGTDENLVIHIVHRIMAAINNPQAEFQFRVENFHVGDKIEQFGNHNVGKVSR